MTKKLRYKFILFASGAVTLLLLLILGAINITNFALVASSSDTLTATLAEKGGKFDDFGPGGFNPDQQGTPGGDQPFNPGPVRPDDPGSADMQGSIRYFTVQFSSDGTPTLLANRLSFFDEATAIDYAKQVHQKGYGTGWYAKYYRYRSYTYNQVDYVSFIDASRELSPSYNVLYASIGGGLGGIALSALVLIPLSKLLVKPTEEAWRKQKRFVSDASHELKTPLSIISANNEISELTYGETEQTKAISKQVKTMNKLVKNLNALAKFDEGQALNKTEIDLSSILTETANGFISQDQDKHTTSLDIQEGIAYQGDEGAMRALYQTVLENAFKYGVSTISVSLHKDDDRIVTIIDNDAEIGEDGPLDRFFERFYRSDEARASSVEGSGIGLAMAKEIVDAHKGRIFAKAENGHFILKIEF